MADRLADQTVPVLRAELYAYAETLIAAATFTTEILEHLGEPERGARSSNALESLAGGLLVKAFDGLDDLQVLQLLAQLRQQDDGTAVGR